MHPNCSQTKDDGGDNEQGGGGGHRARDVSDASRASGMFFFIHLFISLLTTIYNLTTGRTTSTSLPLSTPPPTNTYQQYPGAPKKGPPTTTHQHYPGAPKRCVIDMSLAPRSRLPRHKRPKRRQTRCLGH